MAKTIKVVQGDANLAFTATITDDETGDPVDLSASTVRLYYREVGGSGTPITVNCTLPGGGTDGVVGATLPASCFVNAGSFEAEVEVTTGSQVKTVPKKQLFEVREQIG